MLEKERDRKAKGGIMADEMGLGKTSVFLNNAHICASNHHEQQHTNYSTDVPQLAQSTQFTDAYCGAPCAAHTVERRVRREDRWSF
jgi:hypothetical protein